VGRFTAVPWVLQNNRFSEQAESRAALPNYGDGRIPLWELVLAIYVGVGIVGTSNMGIWECAWIL